MAQLFPPLPQLIANTGNTPDRLISADPSTWSVADGWKIVMNDFFASETGQRLLAYLQERLKQKAVIFPPMPLRAFELTPPEDVRIVILGQDPYHGLGQAEGLAFSVKSGVPMPPSLKNIFKEIQRDLGVPVPNNPGPGGSLVNWARHGVLLLNSCLTVEESQPASHAKKGWEALTDDVIKQVSNGKNPVLFMLWGAYAQSKRELIDQSRHKILISNHPSPLSALRPPLPFIGCGHFSEARDWYEQRSALAPWMN